jgi:serine protease
MLISRFSANRLARARDASRIGPAITRTTGEKALRGSNNPFQWAAVALLCASLAACGGGNVSINGGNEEAADAAPVAEGRVAALIVKRKSDLLHERVQLLSREAAQQMSSTAGARLTPVRVLGNGAHLLRLDKSATTEEATALAQRLQASGDILYAEPDLPVAPALVPNDADFRDQWSLLEPESTPGAVNAVDAWDVTTGDPNLVVAVLDTGILAHPDMAGRILAGYDFVSNSFAGNDGGGRDADAADPGDGLTQEEATQLGISAPRHSTWHGTHVAGIIAATGGNSRQVAGLNWRSRILPVRVLGKGGGVSSDTADAIRWAAGGAVPGVPNNPTPARVINLSLSGRAATSCPVTYQNAIDYALSRGAVVVAAAGNEATRMENTSPANCRGVIAVAANNKQGGLSAYSNYGTLVAITAPGGDHKVDSMILSLGDTGTLIPTNSGTLTSMQGTSMATPNVAGIVSLMLSVNPALTAEQVKSILQYTARKFPAGAAPGCGSNLCGAGIANASAAVRAAASSASAPVSSERESGWYWNAAQGGRGYAIEMRNGSLFFSAFLYDAAGKPLWYVANGKMTDANHFSGPLYRYQGGQSLSGAYKSPTRSGSIGTLDIRFTASNRATLNIAGETVQVERFTIVPNGPSLPQSAFTPDRGWWWNPAEGGRGFALEKQGDTLFIAGFMYDEFGNPVWYVAQGAMSNPYVFQGSWRLYGNGQTLGGAYKPPTIVNGAFAPLTIQFSDSRNAIMTLPGGREIRISRYVDLGSGAEAPIGEVPLSQKQAAKLLGLWRFDFRIISAFTTYFALDHVYEDSADPGQYYAAGINDFEDVVLAGFFPELDSYLIYSSLGENSADLFTMKENADGTMSALCYYFYEGNASDFDTCYPVTATLLKPYVPGYGISAAGGPAGRKQALADRLEQRRSALRDKKMLAVPSKDGAALQEAVKAMRQGRK